MKVSAIVAVGRRFEIGKDNDLLWHLPADMKYFKETTTGHYIITGRRSYMSIPEKYRPLPNRVNVVVTRQADFSISGAEVVNSIEEGVELARNNEESEVFIIGGGQIYNEALQNGLVDKLYLTLVDQEFEADTYFPIIDFNEWEEVFIDFRPNDEKNKYDLTFKVYEKKMIKM